MTSDSFDSLTENKIKYLELIQGIVNRMARNSFLLKGWAVTLVSGIFAILASADTNKFYFLVVFIPVIAFWFLDAYYLLQERLYRELYDKVRKTKDNDQIDFSLNVTSIQANNVKDVQGQSCPKDNFKGLFKCLASKTESIFYGALMLVCLGIFLILLLS